MFINRPTEGAARAFEVGEDLSPWDMALAGQGNALQGVEQRAVEGRVTAHRDVAGSDDLEPVQRPAEGPGAGVGRHRQGHRRGRGVPAAEQVGGVLE